MVYPPFIERAPSIYNKPDGSVLFECICNANPEPTIKWLFKDQEIVPSERYLIKMKKQVGKYACTMVIKGPNQQDQGIYKVTATNAQGSHCVEQNYVLKCTSNEVFKTSNSNE